MPLRVSVAVTAGLLLTAALARGEAPPDDGFLEFLSILIQENDGYLDPLDMTGLELPDADSSPGEDHTEVDDTEVEDTEENSDE